MFISFDIVQGPWMVDWVHICNNWSWNNFPGSEQFGVYLDSDPSGRRR